MNHLYCCVIRKMETPAQANEVVGFLATEFRGVFGFGRWDISAKDDTPYLVACLPEEGREVVVSLLKAAIERYLVAKKGNFVAWPVPSDRVILLADRTPSEAYECLGVLAKNFSGMFGAGYEDAFVDFQSATGLAHVAIRHRPNPGWAEHVAGAMTECIKEYLAAKSDPKTPTE